MGLLDDAIKEHLELKRRRGADAGEISRLESEALGPVPRSAEGVPELADTFEPPSEEPDAPGADAAAPSSPAAARPWEDEPSAGRGSPPPTPADEPARPAPSSYEPPAAPPRPSSHEPPAAPPAPSSYEPPSVPPAPSSYEPPAAPPPPSSYEPPPVTPPPLPDPTPAAASPALPYEPPPVVPPPAREPWMTDDIGPPTPAPDPEPEPAPEPQPASGGLFSRLRGARRSKQDREPPPPAAAPEPEPDLYAPPPPHTSHDAAPAVEHEPDIVPADDEPDVEDLLEETPEFLEETPEHDRLWFEQRPPRDFNFDD